MTTQIGKAILFLIVDSAKVCTETWMKIAGLETDTGAPNFAQAAEHDYKDKYGWMRNY
jgi:hypothetical protein